MYISATYAGLVHDVTDFVQIAAPAAAIHDFQTSILSKLDHKLMEKNAAIVFFIPFLL